MKKSGFFDKLIFIINGLLAFALLISYLLPYIPPRSFPLISVLSLGVPLLIVANAGFVFFWGIRLKRQVLLSLVVLLIGYNHVLGLFALGDEKPVTEESLAVMSYNVRMFNEYQWSSDTEISKKIAALITEKDPDILATQEHYIGTDGIPDIYPYEFATLKSRGAEFGSAIFSKFPIINRKSLDFPQHGNNNAIYADVVKGKDTIRVFNVHFQSLNITPDIGDLQKEDSKKLAGRIGAGFKLQQDQMEVMMKEVENSPYKTLILGDFNNTAFSYLYRQIKGERFKDSFLEAGTGFGRTFNVDYFPLRIDFILVENTMEVHSSEVYRVKYSDHYPLMARISL